MEIAKQVSRKVDPTSLCPLPLYKIASLFSKCCVSLPFSVGVLKQMQEGNNDEVEGRERKRKRKRNGAYPGAACHVIMSLKSEWG